MTPSFRALTAVERVDTNEFHVDIDPGSFIVRGPNGGYLAAVLMRALTQRVADIEGPRRPPRSLTVHYPAAPTVGPATITTDVIRAGRSLVTASARLEQGGAPMAAALAAFSPAWPSPGWNDAAAPSPPGPDSDEVVARDRPPMPFTSYWDYRFTNLGTRESAVVEGWIRPIDRTAIDAITVAAIMDAFPPAVFSRSAAPNPVPTVDLTTHFRADIDSLELSAGEFVFAQFHTQQSIDGFIEEDGRLWTADGTLLAHSRQLAITLPG